MKAFAIFALCLSSCTIIPTQHGNAQFWGDYTDVDFSDGSVKFSSKSMRHSLVVRNHWRGLTTLGAQAASAATGGATGAGASVLSNAVDRNTSRPSQ